MRKFGLMAVALAAMPFLWPSGASAGVEFQASVDGGVTFTTICGPTPGTCSGSTVLGGVAFNTASATSNSPGTPALADLLSDTVSITNNGAANANIVLRVDDTGYLAPTVPPGTATFESAIGATVVVPGAANTLSYLSCIDEGTVQPTPCPGTISVPPVSVPITAVGSGNNSDSINVATLTAPYSMGEEMTITLAPTSDINFSASTRLTPNIPEPASLTLLGSALIGMGWLARRRRKSL